jgi:Na+-transporting methylmalonyl-CoA/oxaloacetate decarboxylase gamma subunit
MEIDWGLAAQIGGFGFVLVFAVLIMLALSIWFVGVIVGRVAASKAEGGQERERT